MPEIKQFYLVKLSSELIAIIANYNLSVEIKELPHNALRAYNLTVPTVKTGQPLVVVVTKVVII